MPFQKSHKMLNWFYFCNTWPSSCKQSKLQWSITWLHRQCGSKLSPYTISVFKCALTQGQVLKHLCPSTNLIQNMQWPKAKFSNAFVFPQTWFKTCNDPRANSQMPLSFHKLDSKHAMTQGQILKCLCLPTNRIQTWAELSAETISQTVDVWLVTTHYGS